MSSQCVWEQVRPNINAKEHNGLIANRNYEGIGSILKEFACGSIQYN